MKTIVTILMLALLSATLILPGASANTLVNVKDLDSSCPPTTVERAICIVWGIAGPTVTFVLDETFYHANAVIDLVEEECNHLTRQCPLIAITKIDGVDFDLFA